MPPKLKKPRTAQKVISESDRRFRDFFENAPVGFYILKNGAIVDINQAALEIIGCTRKEIMGKGKWEKLIVPEQRHLFEVHLEELMHHGRIHDAEYTLRRKDGQLIHILFNATAQFERSGRLATIRCSLLDITAKKRLEESIRELPHRIILAQEEERNLIAQQIHDDFGQLLVALKIFLVNNTMDLIIRYPALKGLFEDLKGKINVILEKARNLSHELAPPGLKYVGLVQAIRELVDSAPWEKSLSVKFHHRDLKDLEFESRDIIIYRIVQEALTNIMKHAQARNVVIRMWYQKGKIHLSIKDDGKGFDVKGYARTGTGLGLSLMRERVKLAAGALQIKSSHGSGTQIHLSFPVKKKNTPG